MKSKISYIPLTLALINLITGDASSMLPEDSSEGQASQKRKREEEDESNGGKLKIKREGGEEEEQKPPPSAPTSVPTDLKRFLPNLELDSENRLQWKKIEYSCPAKVTRKGKVNWEEDYLEKFIVSYHPLLREEASHFWSIFCWEASLFSLLKEQPQGILDRIKQVVSICYPRGNERRNYIYEGLLGTLESREERKDEFLPIGYLLLMRDYGEENTESMDEVFRVFDVYIGALKECAKRWSRNSREAQDGNLQKLIKVMNGKGKERPFGPLDWTKVKTRLRERPFSDPGEAKIDLPYNPAEIKDKFGTIALDERNLVILNIDRSTYEERLRLDSGKWIWSLKIEDLQKGHSKEWKDAVFKFTEASEKSIGKKDADLKGAWKIAMLFFGVSEGCLQESIGTLTKLTEEVKRVIRSESLKSWHLREIYIKFVQLLRKNGTYRPFNPLEWGESGRISSLNQARIPPRPVRVAAPSQPPPHKGIINPAKAVLLNGHLQRVAAPREGIPALVAQPMITVGGPAGIHPAGLDLFRAQLFQQMRGDPRKQWKFNPANLRDANEEELKTYDELEECANACEGINEQQRKRVLNTIKRFRIHHTHNAVICTELMQSPECRNFSKLCHAVTPGDIFLHPEGEDASLELRAQNNYHFLKLAWESVKEGSQTNALLIKSFFRRAFGVGNCCLEAQGRKIDDWFRENKNLLIGLEASIASRTGDQNIFAWGHEMLTDIMEGSEPGRALIETSRVKENRELILANLLQTDKKAVGPVPKDLQQSLLEESIVELARNHQKLEIAFEEWMKKENKYTEIKNKLEEMLLGKIASDGEITGEQMAKALEGLWPTDEEEPQ